GAEGDCAGRRSSDARREDHRRDEGCAESDDTGDLESGLWDSTAAGGRAERRDRPMQRRDVQLCETAPRGLLKPRRRQRLVQVTAAPRGSLEVLMKPWLPVALLVFTQVPTAQTVG